ncbi:MAG: molybdopterin molybdotransferase MoeA [Sphingomicrobium sp.]
MGALSGMISFDEAVERVRETALPIGVETLELSEAARRVLAQPVVARIDSPRADVSAMDGYAVREADLSAFPASLPVVGASYAGAAWNGELKAGTSVRIFTGAPVPKGADRVIIQENVEQEGDLANLAAHPGPARHIRKRGGDFKAGDTLLQAGRLLDARAIVAAAGADSGEVNVYVRPLVTILATGDELAEPGTAAKRPDAIPESVSFGVAALVEQWGGLVLARRRLGDHLSTITQAAAEACAESHLVVVTGGASVGEKDFAKPMFGPLGLELIFSKVAIKPGKPVWLGRAGGTLVIGLPGNPTSALATARLLLAPLLCGLVGRGVDEALKWRLLPIHDRLNECGPRETFHRGSAVGGHANLLLNQDSSAQHALAEADLLLRQRANAPGLEAGALVEVLDF